MKTINEVLGRGTPLTKAEKIALHVANGAYTSLPLDVYVRWEQTRAAKWRDAIFNDVLKTLKVANFREAGA